MQSLSPADVAAQLGVSRRAVYDWIKRGTISARYVATSGAGSHKRYLIKPDAVGTLRSPAYPPPGAKCSRRGGRRG